jgi:energy-coupling factor transporter transmembrane protein EcfT
MLIMNLAFQFFPLLTEETKNVRMGLESRGISLTHPRLGLRLRATAAWMLAVMTAVLERSHRTAAALQVKEGGRGRTLTFRFPEWSMAGTTCVALTIATVALWFLVDGSHPP